MKRCAWIVVVVLLLFTICKYPGSAIAAIVINEFSSDTLGNDTDPDWIELYNTGSESVDLSIFRLRDNTSTNTQDFSETIGGNGFLWVNLEIANMLNKAGDRLKLVQKANESAIVDEIVYGSEDGASVAAPSSGQSAGRKTDGSQEWVLFASSSKGSSNSTNQIAMIPSSNTPTQIPPTRTPTPTKSPTPIKTPTPTKSPTPVKSNATVTPRSTNTTQITDQTVPKKAVLADADIEATDEAWGNQPTIVFSESAVSPSVKPEKRQTLVKSASTLPIFGIFSIVIALAIIGYAILFYFKKRMVKIDKL